MKPCFAHTAIVLGIIGFSLLAGGRASAEEILATGGQYGGTAQAIDVCYVFNAGSSPVQLQSLVIRDQNGTAVDGDDHCAGVTLEPTQTCAFGVTLPINQNSYSCTVQVAKGSKEDLRGIMDTRDSNQNVLINSILR
jgi:hypothetical protein